MADVQQYRFGRGLQTAFTLRQAHTLGSVLPDVFPVVSLDEPPAAQALYYGEDLCSGGAIQTAAAGDLPIISLRNPINSGKILTIERVIISTSAAAIVRGAFESLIGTPAVTGGGVGFRDSRRNSEGVPAADMCFRSQVASLTSPMFHLRTLAGAPVVLDFPAVIGPQKVAPRLFSFVSSVVAGTLDVTFFWRERLAQPGEETAQL